MLQKLKKLSPQHKMHEEVLKDKIFMISVAVVLWASACAYIVKTNFETTYILDANATVPPVYFFDLAWLIAYITLLLGLQFAAIKGVDPKRSWEIIGAILFAGITQVLMYYSYYVLMNLELAIIVNSWNLIAIMSAFVLILRSSKLGSVLLLPYSLMSGVSLIHIYYVIQLN